MNNWKFAPSNCGSCGVSLAKKKPADVELMAQAREFEEPFPDRYAAPCPSCGNYNLVVSAKTEPEPVEPAEPEPTGEGTGEGGEGSEEPAGEGTGEGGEGSEEPGED